MAEPACLIQVELAYAPAPRQVLRQSLRLPQGSTLAQAVQASAFAALPEVQQWLTDPAQSCLTAGVWGKKAVADAPLRDQDRVELYRSLLVDPKVARRERFRKQGSKGAGLFVRQRTGGKPGY